MNYFIKIYLITVSFFFFAQHATAAENPKALAAALSAAIEAKDVAAAGKLVQWEQAPIMAYRFFKMSIADCIAAGNCKVEVAAMDEEEKKPQADYFFTVAPEGKLKLVTPEDSDGFSMPFAKIDNQYKIILGQQTEEAYAKSKAAVDARKIAEEIDSDVITTGQPLPADGGAPAVAYQKYLAAIKEGNTSYLAQHGTQTDKFFFGDTYKNDTIKLLINLELARMESIAQPVIKGGFLKDNKAVLLVSGTNGLGWTSEGAVLLMLNENTWSMEDKSYASYSPKP